LPEADLEHKTDDQQDAIMEQYEKQIKESVRNRKESLPEQDAAAEVEAELKLLDAYACRSGLTESSATSGEEDGVARVDDESDVLAERDEVEEAEVHLNELAIDDEHADNPAHRVSRARPMQLHNQCQASSSR
jgi:hypothetical protein